MPRPRIEIDWTQFDSLCGIQCTLREIAAFFKVSEDTIERACKRERKKSFAEYYELKRGMGRISLRRRQWEAAMQGDRAMLIWLGKQYLDQRDEVDLGDSASELENFKKDRVSPTPFNPQQTLAMIIELRRTNAIQIESPREVHVQPTPSNREAMVGSEPELPDFAGLQEPISSGNS